MTKKREFKKAPEDGQWLERFPNVISSERALLGLVLDKCSLFSRIDSCIKATDITDNSLQIIYRLLQEYYANDTEWTWQSVLDALGHMKKLPVDLERPASFITQLLVEKADDDDLDFYLEQLLSLQIRKELHQRLPTFERVLFDPSKSPVHILRELKGLQGITTRSGKIYIEREVSKDNLSEVFMEEAEEIRRSKFIGSGYESIDSVLSWGFHKGQVSIIYGRPTMGKSTLRANIQVNLNKIGIDTLCISLEQSRFAEVCRLVAIREGISLTKIIRVKEWSDGFRQYIEEKIKEMESDWSIKIIEPAGSYFLSDVKQAVIQARQAGCNPKIVFIDLFAQLGDVSVDTNTAQVIVNKLMKVAELAKELQVHIGLVVQASRFGPVKGKQREDIDQREKLYGSDGYLQRADMVFMVSREAYYNEDVEDITMRISLLKQKDGAQKSVVCSFDKTTLRLTDDLETTGNFDKETGEIDNPLGDLDD